MFARKQRILFDLLSNGRQGGEGYKASGATVRALFEFAAVFPAHRRHEHGQSCQRRPLVLLSETQSLFANFAQGCTRVPSVKFISIPTKVGAGHPNGFLGEIRF
jgi:hypothetical protein